MPVVLSVEGVEQEQYEESIRRLSGKERAESRSDRPVDGLLGGSEPRIVSADCSDQQCRLGGGASVSRPAERKFTEPVALSSTQPTDVPLPRSAARLSLDLVALRARCTGEPRASQARGQERSTGDCRSLRLF